MRPLRRSIAAAAGLACLLPASAGAITLGSTQRGDGLASTRCDQPRFGTGHVHYQAITLPGLPSSVAPAAGTITSWRSDQFGGGDPGGILTLIVLRPTGAGELTIVASDAQILPPAILRGDTVFTPVRPISMAAGDVIGLYGNDDRSGCLFFGGRSTEAWGHAEIGTLTLGTTFRPRVQTFVKTNVAAELSPGGGSPTPNPPAPPPPPPGPPTIGPDGRPTVSRSGQVSSGQSVGCSEAGPCRVVTTAVVYYTSGQVIAARARARRRALVVGRRTFTIPAGDDAAVTFPLNRAGRRALARLGRLWLTVTTTVRQGSARPLVSRRSFTIRAPRRAARRRARR